MSGDTEMTVDKFLTCVRPLSIAMIAIGAMLLMAAVVIELHSLGWVFVNDIIHNPIARLVQHIAYYPFAFGTVILGFNLLLTGWPFRDDG